MRLRFWLAVLDIAHALDWQPAILWAIGRCANATEWE
jgi:hypothetical protein